MNEEVLDVLRWIVFAVVIFSLISCGLRCFVFDEDDDDEDHPTHPRGPNIDGGIKAAEINPSVLLSIPIVLFSSCDFEDNVECVVCLSDLVDGDKTRVLPSCNHWFHAECIDAWLQSQATCPICRKSGEEIQNHELQLSTNTDSGEAQEDMTAEVVINMPAEVVIDMPAEPEIRESSGQILATVLNQL